MITVCPKFTLTSTPESLSPELCLTTYKLLSRPKIRLQMVLYGYRFTVFGEKLKLYERKNAGAI